MFYQAPWWLPGGNLQTIYAALGSKRYLAEAPNFHRERWATPDDDFVDVDFAQHTSAAAAPLLVVFHGLEGSSASHYAEAFADFEGRFDGGGDADRFAAVLLTGGDYNRIFSERITNHLHRLFYGFGVEGF